MDSEKVFLWDRSADGEMELVHTLVTKKSEKTLLATIIKLSINTTQCSISGMSVIILDPITLMTMPLL